MSQAAEYLGISKWTIIRRLKEGSFPKGEEFMADRLYRTWTKEQLDTVELRPIGRPKKVKL